VGPKAIVSRPCASEEGSNDVSETGAEKGPTALMSCSRLVGCKKGQRVAVPVARNVLGGEPTRFARRSESWKSESRSSHQNRTKEGETQVQRYGLLGMEKIRCSPARAGDRSTP